MRTATINEWVLRVKDIRRRVGWVAVKRIRAVAFDAWGTLFDEGENSLVVTANRIVEDMSLRMSGGDFLNLWTEFYLEHVSDSHNIKETKLSSLAAAFKNLGVEGDAEKYVSFLIEHRSANSIVYPEVPKVLQSIGTLPKCIISNIDNDTLLKTLETNHLNFDYIMTSEMARDYKPNPTIFLEALKLMDCRSKEVLFVGDSQEDDVAGARNVGIAAVWVNRHGESLREDVPKPDYEIEDLTGLVTVLRELGFNCHGI